MTECASPYVANPICLPFVLEHTGNHSPSNMHSDYYPGLNAITISGSIITANNEFNYYLPV